MAPDIAEVGINGAPELGRAVLHQKYTAFRRTDIYGEIGEGALPLSDRLRLYLGAVSLLPLRVVLSLFFVCLFYVTCRVTTLFTVPVSRAIKEEGATKHVTNVGYRINLHMGRFCARAVLFACGFYHISKTSKSGGTSTGSRPCVIVSNHISWLDILYHMADTLPSFVAKSGTAKAPLVGLISQCMGCIYVERENKAAGQLGAAGLLVERMRAVEKNASLPPVLVFPEGTTTNGRYLVPFKTGAFLAGTPVLPVILKYPHQRFNPSWESIEFPRHVFLLMCQLVNHLEVKELPVYVPSEAERKDPALYAKNVWELVAKEGDLRLSELTLFDKRCYHAILRGQPPPEPTVADKKTQ